MNMEERLDALEKEMVQIKETNIQRDIQISNLVTALSGILTRPQQPQQREKVTFGSPIKCSEENIGKIIGGIKPGTF
jgi:hypothetical protein